MTAFRIAKTQVPSSLLYLLHLPQDTIFEVEKRRGVPTHPACGGPNHLLSHRRQLNHTGICVESD
jgi:hypothetical protein